MEFASNIMNSVANATAPEGATVATGLAEESGLAAGTGYEVGSTGPGAAAVAAPSLFSTIGDAFKPLGSIMSGLATVGSLLAQTRAAQISSMATGNAASQAVLAGNQQGDALDLAAADDLNQIKIEEIQGLDRRNQLRAALVQAIGDRDVATAASGVDLSFGTPVTARKQATTDAERALNVDQGTEDFRKARLREQAANYKLAAQNARAGGIFKATGIQLAGDASQITTLASIMRRG